MTSSQEFSGSVERILFQNQENGYAVFILKMSATQEIVATGAIAQLQAGQQVTISGTWVHHPKFGKQFAITQCSVQLPTSVVGIEKYLGSGLIKGIGKVYAQKIVARFKEQTLIIIEQEPEKLLQIEGIGAKRIELIKQAWHEQKAVSTIMIFLQERVYRQFLLQKFTSSMVLSQLLFYKIIHTKWPKIFGALGLKLLIILRLN